MLLIATSHAVIHLIFAINLSCFPPNLLLFTAGERQRAAIGCALLLAATVEAEGGGSSDSR